VQEERTQERAQLSRTLKPHWVWAIALGSAVGWGAFVLPVDWMATAGPLGAIVGFGIGALLMLVIAVSYGFMIQNFPVSGGEFAYSYLRFGRNQAFVCGWFLTLGYMSIVALNASALALLGKFVVPGIVERGLMYSIAGWEVYFGEVAIASVALIAFAWMNIRGATLSGKMQFVFCVILVIGVALLLIGALLHPDTSLGNVSPLVNPEVPALTAVLAIVAIAPWAYVGFDNVPQAAEEFDFAPARAFRLIVFALIAAALVYSATIFATALAVPWQELVASGPVWGTGEAVAGLFGGLGIFVLAIALCMGIFTGLNGFYISSSRLMFAMGRARILPEVFSHLHPRYRTPYAGIIFTCLVTLAAPWFGRQALLWIVDMSAVGVTIAYFYTCFAAFKLFRWSADDSREGALEGGVSPVKKLLSLLGAISGLSFLGLLLIPGAPGFLGTPSWIALIVWIALGVVFYLSRSREYRQIPKADLDYLIFGEKPEEVAAKVAERQENGTAS
jgi:amino acid transporter